MTLLMDESRLLDIHITDEDIRDGVPKESESCPIALSIKRALADSLDDSEFCGFEVFVTGDDISIDGTMWYFVSAELEATAQAFISSYDLGTMVKHVHPFDAQLTMIKPEYSDDEDEDEI